MNRRGRLQSPGAYVGAAVAEIGGQYSPINSGLLRWQALIAGEESFFFNDQPVNYGDNTGSFELSLKLLRRMSQATGNPAIACTIRRGHHPLSDSNHDLR